MNVDIEILGGLQHCLTISFTDETYKQAVVDYLRINYRDKKHEGILNSKNVLRILQQKFDAAEREDIHQGLMITSFEAAAAQSKFKAAGSPVYKMIESVPDNGFIYSVTFEVYPPVVLPNLDIYNFTQLVAEVTDEEVDHTLSVLRRQQAQWCSVELPAQAGDSVVINCYAKVGERVFDGKGMRVELVNDEMVDGFENGLIGVSVGEKLPVDISFSIDHFDADVAGKTVTFDIEVLSVESRIIPELDADFIKSSGIESGDVDAMRRVVWRNMNAHLQKIIRMKNTLNIFAKILKDHPMELPESLLEEELKRLTCDPCEEVEGVESFKHDIDPAMFTNLAQTRVARSLLVHELAKAKGIILDENEVKERVYDLVEEYPQKEKIIDWFYGDEVRLSGIKSDVLGEQVADLILKESQAEKIKTTYSEMTDFSGESK